VLIRLAGAAWNPWTNCLAISFAAGLSRLLFEERLHILVRRIRPDAGADLAQQLPKSPFFFEFAVRRPPMTIGHFLHLELRRADDFPSRVFRAMHEFGAQFDRQIANSAADGVNPSPDPLARFEQGHLKTRLRQHLRRCQTGDARPEHDHRILHHNSICPSAAENQPSFRAGPTAFWHGPLFLPLHPATPKAFGARRRSPPSGQHFCCSI
jgi:hypothetical protein